MECPRCNFSNPEDTFFCGKCGAKLSLAEGVSDSPTQTLLTPLKELSYGSFFADRYQVIEELGKGRQGKSLQGFLLKKMNLE